MKIKEIYPGLYHIKFKSQYLMAMTFLRVQEYYESEWAEIRGTYFPLEDYMDLYAKQNGNFTYPLDWDGFNIPGEVYNKWAKLFWQYPNMMAKEIDLYNKLLPIINKKSKFYLISSRDKKCLKHEIAHGFYYLNSKYKRAINKLLNPRTKFYRDFKKKLLSMGYCKNVIKDEIQAYCVDENFKDLVDSKNIEDNKKNQKIVDKIKKIYNKHTKKVNYEI